MKKFLLFCLLLCTMTLTVFADDSDFTIVDGVLTEYTGDASVLVIPEGVTSIGTYSIHSCPSLTTVILPSSLVSINTKGDNWYHCPNLTEIIMPTEGKFSEEFGLDLLLENFSNIPYDVTLVGIKLSDEVTEALASWEKWTDPLQTWVNPGNPSTPYESIAEKSNELNETYITPRLEELEKCYTEDELKICVYVPWLIQNIEYVLDADNSPTAVLESGTADCDGYSALCIEMLRAQGIPAYMVHGYGDFLTMSGGHAWVIALVDGEWMWIEPQQKWMDTVYSFLSDYTIYNVDGMSAAPEDTPSDWAKLEVWDAICADLVPGDMQASYAQGITREAFCRLMITLVEQSSGQSISSYLADRGLTTTDPFSDTDAQWVLQAYALGLVYGTSDSTFSPDSTITRQEASAMLARTATLLGCTSGTGTTFTDAGTFASWAVDTIQMVSSLVDPTTGNAVMGGTTENTFSPTDQYTVEQAILTVLRLYHVVSA